MHWRKVILHAKIQQAKKSLEKNLFLSHQRLRPCLLQIQGSCVDILAASRLFYLEVIKSYELTQFVQDQKARTEYVSAIALKEWDEKMRALVERAALGCLRESGFYANSAGEGGAVENGDFPAVPPKKLSYTEQSARRTECLKLKRFVKLSDYLIVNTLHMLLVESLRDFLKSVFQGCSNRDVAVDSTGLGVTLTKEMAGLQKLMNTSSTDNQDKGPESRVIVGGAVVGEEIGTDELIRCGFEGFSQILSRIIRSGLTTTRMADEPAVETNPKSISLAGQPKASTRDVTLMKDKTLFRPLFRTEFLFMTSEVKAFYFSPSLPDYLAAVDVLFKNYIKVLEAFPLLTNSYPFLDPANLSGGSYSSVRGLESSEFNDGPQLGNIALEGGYFRELCGRARGVLVGIFSNAAQWMHAWENIREMWIEDEQFDAIESLDQAAGSIAVLLAKADGSNVEGGIATILQAYKQEQDAAEAQKNPEFVSTPQGVLEIASTVVVGESDTTSYSPVVAFFEDCLKKFAGQKQAMNEIPDTHIVNNLLIDAEKLKSVLLPSPERCFSDVARILPKVAREKNELLLNEVQTWVGLLSSQPASVEAFVEYLGWLDKGMDLHALKLVS